MLYLLSALFLLSQKIIQGLKQVTNLIRLLLRFTFYSQVLRIIVQNDSHASKMAELQNMPEFDFWSNILVGKHVDVMTSEDNLEYLESWLKSNNLDWSIMIPNVQALIELEKIPNETLPSDQVRAGHNMDWTQYHTLEDMYGWFDYLETTYEFCETENIGESFEGRQMIVMKVK